MFANAPHQVVSVGGSALVAAMIAVVLYRYLRRPPRSDRRGDRISLFGPFRRF